MHICHQRRGRTFSQTSVQYQSERMPAPLKDVVKGTIIYVTDTEVMVNIGYRADGIIKLDELSTDENAKPKDLFKKGQEIDVYIIKLDDGEGNVVLSTRRVEGLKNWEARRQIGRASCRERE